MNKRQRAKAAVTKTKAVIMANPVQAAWDVVAQHLLDLGSMGNCYFVDNAFAMDYRELPAGTRLRLTNVRGFELLSSPRKEG